MKSMEGQRQDTLPFRYASTVQPCKNRSITALLKPPHPQNPGSCILKKETSHTRDRLFLGGLLSGLGDLTGTLVSLNDGLDDTDGNGLTLNLC
jgi:hypothetical protein